MKNLLVETDTDVRTFFVIVVKLIFMNIQPLFNLNRHICLMFDDDSNMYEVTVAIKKVVGNDITTEN